MGNMIDAVHRNIKKNQLLTTPPISHIRILIAREGTKSIWVRVWKHTGWPGGAVRKDELVKGRSFLDKKKLALYIEEMQVQFPEAAVVDLVD